MKQASIEAEAALGRLTEYALQSAGCRTPSEALEIVDGVLALARDWFHGGLPLDEVRRQTTPQQRYLAARFLRPQPGELKALLDALVGDNPTAPGGYSYATKHGVFTEDDLRAAGAKFDRKEGLVRIRFPQRQPWRRYPDDEATKQEDRDGERADPFYAEDHEERMKVAQEFAHKRMGAGPKKRRTIQRRGKDE